MTLADAINNLRDGQATKRPVMGGYAHKTVTSSTGVDPETYTLTYVERDGTTHVYTWTGTAWQAPSTPISLDGEFHSNMLADDWIIGKRADFESARSGSGKW